MREENAESWLPLTGPRKGTLTVAESRLGILEITGTAVLKMMGFGVVDPASDVVVCCARVALLGHTVACESVWLISNRSYPYAVQYDQPSWMLTTYITVLSLP
jgi:hypothetical protein